MQSSKYFFLIIFNTGLYSCKTHDEMWQEIKNTKVLPSTLIDSIYESQQWNQSKKLLLITKFKEGTFKLLPEEEKREILANDSTNSYFVLPVTNNKYAYVEPYLELLQILCRYSYLTEEEYDKLVELTKRKFFYSHPYYFFEDILNAMQI